MTSWSMSRRLVITLCVLVGGLWIAGGGLAALVIRQEINEVFDTSLKTTAQRLLPLVLANLQTQPRETGDETHERLANLFRPSKNADHLHFQVRDSKGQIMFRSYDAPAEPFPVPLTRGLFEREGQRYFTVATPDSNVFLHVAELPDERSEAIAALWWGLVAPLVGLLPVAALIVYWTVRRTTRPIMDAQRQIASRGGEDLEPIDPNGLPDELVPIIHDMNRLLERLKTALEAERSFAANSAHELRNPIAAARAQAEVLAENLHGSPDQTRATQIIGILGKLSSRIEKMLQLARAEAGLGLDRIDTDLAAVTKLLVSEYARRPHTDGRVIVETFPDTPVIASTDPDALGIALQNLIDNALAHGDPDKPVSVRIGPGLCVQVVNEGPVVDSKELAALTQRFARAESAVAPGAGLGLSIVNQVMRQAGGRLELVSPIPGRRDGFEARLILGAP
jgi:two-component system, OmpR family, sensor kinase